MFRNPISEIETRTFWFQIKSSINYFPFNYSSVILFIYLFMSYINYMIVVLYVIGHFFGLGIYWTQILHLDLARCEPTHNNIRWYHKKINMSLQQVGSISIKKLGGWYPIIL